MGWGHSVRLRKGILSIHMSFMLCLDAIRQRCCELFLNHRTSSMCWQGLEGRTWCSSTYSRHRLGERPCSASTPSRGGEAVEPRAGVAAIALITLAVSRSYRPVAGMILPDAVQDLERDPLDPPFGSHNCLHGTFARVFARERCQAATCSAHRRSVWAADGLDLTTGRFMAQLLVRDPACGSPAAAGPQRRSRVAQSFVGHDEQAAACGSGVRATPSAPGGGRRQGVRCRRERPDWSSLAAINPVAPELPQSHFDDWHLRPRHGIPAPPHREDVTPGGNGIVDNAKQT